MSMCGRMEDVDVGFRWLSRVLDYCKAYHPNISRVTMNYQNSTSTVVFSVETTEWLKKKIRSILIPGSPGMIINSARDMYYQPIGADQQP